jgi:hypothetical protein
MTNNTAKFANQSAPRPTTSRLNNGFHFTLIEGLWCSWCGENIRSCDAEPLDDDGMRLVCRCGTLILQYGWRP